MKPTMAIAEFVESLNDEQLIALIYFLDSDLDLSELVDAMDFSFRIRFGDLDRDEN